MQAAAGLEQYIAFDRPDIAYSVKTALQQTKLMKLRVIKVARYLKSNRRLVWKFHYQQQPKSIDVFVDADFAARETVLWKIADRIWIQHAKCASTVHGRV